MNFFFLKKKRINKNDCFKWELSVFEYTTIGISRNEAGYYCLCSVCIGIGQMVCSTFVKVSPSVSWWAFESIRRKLHRITRSIRTRSDSNVFIPETFRVFLINRSLVYKKKTNAQPAQWNNNNYRSAARVTV